MLCGSIFYCLPGSNQFYDAPEAWKIMDIYGAVSLFDKMSDRNISQIF